MDLFMSRGARLWHRERLQRHTHAQLHLAMRDVGRIRTEPRLTKERHRIDRRLGHASRE